MPLQGIQPGASEDGGGSLPTDPTFTTVTTTGAIASGGQVSSVATIGLLTSHTTTDATNKTAIFAGRHFTNANRPVGAVVVAAVNGGNSVFVGGGDSNVNAATSVAIHTAASSNVATGTERSRWRATGDRTDTGISTTPTGIAETSSHWTDTNGNPFIRVGTGRIIDIGALGLTPTSVQTASYTAAAGELVLVNPSSASADIAITLPATAADCAVMLTTNAAGPWRVSINRNGNTVNGVTDTDNLSMSRAGQLLMVRRNASGAYSALRHTPSQEAQAIRFNSSITGCYTVANHSSINLTGSLSIGCWFRTTTTAERYIYGGLNISVPAQGYALSINTGLFRFWDGVAWRSTGLNETFNDGVWHLGVATYETGSPNGTVNLYIDGFLVETITSAASSLTSNTTAKAIGAASNGNAQWDGGLQHVFIVNGVLSQANITTMWRNGRGDLTWLLATKPAAWWPMTEGAGASTLADLSGNANTATRTGTVFTTTGHVGLFQ